MARSGERTGEGIKGRKPAVCRRCQAEKKRALYSRRGSVLKTARAGTVQSMHARRDATRGEPVQTGGDRQVLSYYLRYASGSRSNYARRSTSADRRRCLLCATRRAVLFDVLRPATAGAA